MPREEGVPSRLGPDGEISDYNPWIKVKLHINGTMLPRYAVVDSGADSTSISARDATELLGYPASQLPDTQWVRGVNGLFKCPVLKGVTIEYRDWSIIGDVLVVPDPPGDAPLDVVILGRSDFFTHFSVLFHWHKDPPEFWIEPVLPDEDLLVDALKPA